MTLDSEQQRKLLQDLMDSVNFPGRAWKEVYELRVAVENAVVPAPASFDPQKFRTDK